MKQYIGTKIVKMRPMNRAEYNIFRGWALPADEDGTDEGYLVEYLDGGKPNVAGHDGYVSWSPKAQAENAYRETDGMSFGLALEALKKGLKVCRVGWNGKGMWLSLSHHEIGRGVSHEKFWSKNNSEFALNQPFGCAEVEPCITMKTVRDTIQMGWNATQSDMMADDWQVVE